MLRSGVLHNLSFRAAIARNTLASAGILFIIFMMLGFHTGDLNPIWTRPMLGTHKTRQSNPCQPAGFHDLP